MNASKEYELQFNNILKKEEYRRNQEQFVKRLVNAQSHFQGQEQVLGGALDSRDKIIALKTHAKRFQMQERENQISKNNAMLIKNLLEISHGKRTSVPVRGGTAAGPVMMKRAMSSKPRSLNEAVRRKEMERIAKENFQMVQRLHKGTSVISKKQLEDDFRNHVRYRDNIRKGSAAPAQTLLPPRAPALI